MADLEERLGYRFTNKGLLLRALTHPSYGAERHAPDYQRLEFLGDAVLELAVSEYLFSRFPDAPEGRLTFARARLVREETLFEAAVRLHLGGEILLSVGEDRSGGRTRPSILSDVMEAIIAAVYLDGGQKPAFDLVRRLLGGRMDSVLSEEAMDFKSRLQMRTQKKGLLPEYRLIEKSGPPHNPHFVVAAALEGQPEVRGEGGSKRQAEQEAAQAAFETWKL